MHIPKRTFTYFKEFCQVWSCKFSKHVTLGESLKRKLAFLLEKICNSCRIQEERTISAKSANRTQNFSSCTSRNAIGSPSLSVPKTVEALLEPPSKRTSFPYFMPWCNCESVPFLHTDTNGAQACDVSVLSTVDTAPVMGLRMAILCCVQPDQQYPSWTQVGLFEATNSQVWFATTYGSCPNSALGS